jgi:uroporphyrin-III C-methyltransferase/precorrin-2 dehydrogenase/sirohydrochlorin ferrochelatase
MPGKTIRELAKTAVAQGLAADTPAVAIASATRPEQQLVRGTIGDIAQRLEDAALSGPLLVMIGHALSDAVTEAAGGEAVTRKDDQRASEHKQAS